MTRGTESGVRPPRRDGRDTRAATGGAPPRIASLATIVSSRAPALILSDVWGVLHNGVRAHGDAVAALSDARARGVRVVLVTNSPRPRDGVAAQLDMLGVARDAWDRIITSGDVTRDLIRAGPERVHHLGPPRDRPLFEGTGVELVDDDAAGAIVCTGLLDDESEEPADYRERLEGWRARNLPMIVANPDIVVERGDRLVWCAGALARDYRTMGGETRVAGKPHAPIYAAALAAGAKLLGEEPEADRVLAIGDGMPTDVRGALDAGLPLLFVAGGIHVGEYGGAEPEPDALAAFLHANDAAHGIVGWMPHLA